jgi:hypothetical protein
MTTEPGSYADVAECLFREFEPVHELWTITQVVHQCRAELEGSPLASVPGTLESLARERLENLPVLTFPTIDQDWDEFTSAPVGRGR